MSTRKIRGLDAIRNAAVQAAPAIHVLPIGDIPSVCLTAKEVAAATRLSYDRILGEIHAGRIEVIPGGQQFVIPVDQLAVIRSWAVRLDPTA